MKIVLPLFCAVASVLPAKANVIPLSIIADVTATGEVRIYVPGNDKILAFDESQSASGPLTSINQSVAGKAELPIPSPFPSGYFIHTDSKAAQSASIGANGIALAGDIGAFNWAHPGYPVSQAVSHATTTFDVTFRVEGSATFDLMLTGFGLYNSGIPFTPPLSSLLDFSFSALDGSMSIGLGDLTSPSGFFSRNYWDVGTSGILAAGDYRLVHNLMVYSNSDPIGDSGTANFSLNLAITPTAATVADGGALHLSLLFSIGTLIWLRRSLR